MSRLAADEPAPTLTVRQAARRWFFRPPRPHGQVIEDRSVGHLELFYDLVYVVFVGRLAHHLAEHITTRGVIDFVVLFSVLWLTWFNGSIYHELHGREDGRARGLMFAQMLLLALLAVYAADAGGEDGSAFAWVLVALLTLQTFQWWTVYKVDDPDQRQSPRRYITGSIVAIGVTVVAALVDDPDERLAVFALMLVVAIGGATLLLSRLPAEMQTFRPTPSLVERFGLFVIIVLGEIVVGMVDGLSGDERDTRAVITGLLALTLSFGFWWTYFDLVGDRLPERRPRAFVGWLVAHLPLTLAIAASGAGLVGLIEHAAEGHTPQPVAWLLSGSVAVVLLTCVPLARTVGGQHAGEAEGKESDEMIDPEDGASGGGPADPAITLALLAGAVAALLIGALHPAPWLLALLLLLVLVVLWWFSFLRWLAAGGAAHVARDDT